MLKKNDPRFPTFLYISPGPHHGPPGTTYDTSPPVTNETELEDALELGFHLTLAQAVGLVPAEPKPSELRALAEAKEAEEKKRFDDAVEAKVQAELAKKGKPGRPPKAAALESEADAEKVG